MRPSAPSRQLTLGLFLFALVVGLGIDGILHSIATSPETSLSRFGDFLRRDQGADSWVPMHIALDQHAASPAKPIYRVVFFEGQIKFQYPLTALLPLVTLRALLPPRDAIEVALWLGWLSILVLAVASIGIFQRSLRRHAAQLAQVRRREALLRGIPLLLLCLTFYPAMQAYTLGQIQIWINALLALALWCWIAERPRTSGVLVGLAALIKPHYGFLLLWSLLRRRFSFALAFTATLAVGLGVSLAIFGAADHVDYFEVLSFVSSRGESYYPNQSVNGLLHRWLANGFNLHFHPREFPPYHAGVHAATLVSSVLLLGLALLWPARAERRGGATDFCIALLSCTIAAPIAWEHHYGVLLPIYALAIPMALARGGGLTGLLLVGYAVSSSFFEPTPELAASRLNVLQSSLFFAGLVVLGCLYHLLLRGPAEPPAQEAAPASAAEAAQVR